MNNIDVKSRLPDDYAVVAFATPHFVPTALVRGYYISGHKAPQPVLRTIILIVTKALACVYFYRQKDKKTYIMRTFKNPSGLCPPPLYRIATQRRKSIPLSRNMFLCSYVLINYPYVCYTDAIKLRALRACFARVFTSPQVFIGHQ